MAQQTVDELVVKLSLDVAKMQDGLQKAQTGINQFADKISSTLGGVLSAVAVKFAYTFGKDLVQSFADAGSKMNFMSQQLGESVEKLGAWGEAVKRNGGTAEGFQNTLTQLHNKLQDISFGGDKETAGWLGMLGIGTHTKDGAIKQGTEVLLEIGDKLRGQSKSFQQFYGRKLGIDDATLRTIVQGRKETEAYIATMQRQGVMTTKQAEAATKAKQRLDDLNQKVTNLKMNVAERLLPTMYKFTDWLMDFVDNKVPKMLKAFDDWQKETGITGDDLAKFGAVLAGLAIATPIINALSLAFKGLAASVGLVTSPLGGVVAALGTVYEVYKQYEEFKKDPSSFNTEDKSLTNVKGKLGRLFQYGETIGNTIYDAIHPSIDVNKPKIQSSQFDAIINNLAPRIAQIESTGGTNINSGNGAYGAYQVRPRWGNKARAQEGLSPMSSEWYLDPTNSYETYKLMMRQNLKSTGGDLDKAVKMYSGGNYGLDKVLQQKISNINPALIGNPASLTTKIPQGSKQSNNQPAITVQNMNVSANNPKDLARKTVEESQAMTGLSYPNVRVA